MDGWMIPEGEKERSIVYVTQARQAIVKLTEKKRRR